MRENPLNKKTETDRASLRRGVVAVISRGNRFLVIRRSQFVEAAGWFCFPGGAIEAHESQEEALRRELREELGVEARPIRRLWNSVTSWGVTLDWWSAGISPVAQLIPCKVEVESWEWLTVEEMRRLPRLLESNIHFLDALQRGEFSLDER
jgi:8-oxo-dGTP pyrophosphatase MutT (NUDIX family)